MLTYGEKLPHIKLLQNNFIAKEIAA